MTIPVIDTQYHCAVPSLAALQPYFDDSTMERLRRTRFTLPEDFVHPGGGILPEGTKIPTAAEVAADISSETTAKILVPHQIYPTAGWTDTYLCAGYAAALNNYFIDNWLPVDPRFKLAIAVSPHEPALAVAEIERLATNKRVVAIAMPVIAINLGQSHYRPILEAANKHKLPLIVHPSGQEGLVIGTPALGGVGPRQEGEYEALVWQVATANIASLIFDGVFLQLPDLKVIFSGYGFSWAPPFVWRANMEWRNMRIDVPWITEPPSQIASRHIRLVIDDLDSTPPEMLHHLVNVVPKGVLMYGSNGAFGLIKEDVLLAALPDGARADVASGNAAATFCASRLA